nr:MAG TPA: hypothetical protein [Caudoviricetes sp.]
MPLPCSGLRNPARTGAEKGGRSGRRLREGRDGDRTEINK